MKKLKYLNPGTIVELTPSIIEWKSTHADELTNFPEAFLNIHPKADPKNRNDEFASYLMERYSHNYGLKIHGVIVGDNGYNDDDLAYLVWSANQIGEDIEWLQPNDFEVIG